MSKSTHIRLIDRTPENDIKYKAPLSYRYIRILGWFFLILATIGALARINIKMFPQSEAQIGWVATAGEFFTNLPLPLFLLANFTIILGKKGGSWKRLLIFYGGVALLMYLAGIIVMSHYVYGFFHSLGINDFQSMAELFGYILFSLGNSGLIFNLFIDLFLCSLLYFFLNYTPKCFKGDKTKILIFRFLILLPIAYEIASIIIKYNIAMGNMPIPFYFFFLLTSKPPLMFVAFLALVLFLKIQDAHHAKQNRDPEQIKAHKLTNAHSLRFSIQVAVVFLIAGIIDIIIHFTISVFVGAFLTEKDPELIDYAVNFAVYVSQSMGFGKAGVLVLIAPIALLFSYTKTHKNPKVDLFIPITGIAIILFIYLEGMFQIITSNIPIVIEKLKEQVNHFFGG